MKFVYLILIGLLWINSSFLFSQQDTLTVIPLNYERALRNPMMGFSGSNLKSHPWGTLTTFKFPLNKLENHESDGIDKIISASNEMWGEKARSIQCDSPAIKMYFAKSFPDGEYQGCLSAGLEDGTPFQTLPYGDDKGSGRYRLGEIYVKNKD